SEADGQDGYEKQHTADPQCRADRATERRTGRRVDQLEWTEHDPATVQEQLHHTKAEYYDVQCDQELGAHADEEIRNVLEHCDYREAGSPVPETNKVPYS